jgi:hypothetical protein
MRSWEKIGRDQIVKIFRPKVSKTVYLSGKFNGPLSTNYLLSVKKKDKWI